MIALALTSTGTTIQVDMPRHRLTLKVGPQLYKQVDASPRGERFAANGVELFVPRGRAHVAA